MVLQCSTLISSCCHLSKPGYKVLKPTQHGIMNIPRCDYMKEYVKKTILTGPTSALQKPKEDFMVQR